MEKPLKECWYKMLDYLINEHSYDFDFIYGDMMPTWWTEGWLDNPSGFVDSVQIVHKATKIPYETLIAKQDH